MYQSERIQISAEMKISDMVLANPYSMLMLEHFGIELPLQEKLIKDICAARNINTSLFLAFANLYNGLPYSFTESFSYNEIDTIISYLKNSHQYYVREIYPRIIGIIKQLNVVNSNTEEKLVEKFFNEYFSEVKEHLDYENEIVFPYVDKLYHCISGEKILLNISQYSVGEYKDHHNDIEEKLDDLMNLLIKYLPQKNDQSIRRELLLSLFQLDHDLKIHSQIEDFILIPLVAQMEKLLQDEG
jgi:regulator of cell morphogenesis and NO signaling